MGDLQTDQGETLELRYVPVSEFTRVVNAKAGATAKAAAFAALARVNTLYMIAGAWSGHIGTSFSSLEIMSWLFLNELRDLGKGPDECDICTACGATTFHPFAVRLGPLLLAGDACTTCAEMLGIGGIEEVAS